ncbi:MAG: methyltransferase domain-containing protein [Candidatus Nitrohelix vancouverensis]|uniref:D-alanine--D-alanine ligase n=1 Tax=Candidatus Nitrohelix vancouverensis TaxID=2705534 RepID=A0A7T0C0N4_9BACT|nr:MAG: methyltransferase domain-containing protein [Candidatus Nitrohelix vancouverensis]
MEYKNPNEASKTPASPKSPAKKGKLNPVRTLGPVSDLERHLPPEWWRDIFNSLYLKTDGDVVENDLNTVRDIDWVVKSANLQPSDHILDLCCGQGRHTLELASRGFQNVAGLDRSRYLIRLARKRAKKRNLKVQFSEGDARKFRSLENSRDCVIVMGNSFGYFEREEDDIQILESIKRILKSEGKLVLDIVDGVWMAQNFEPRSWEWIDQTHFVNRERSLTQDRKRIISREVITNSEIGVLADQFYAERLYTLDEITALLKKLDFTQVQSHGNLVSESTRGQDLGMMANRLFITARGPVKAAPLPAEKKETSRITVLMGDPRLPDSVKKDGKFNAEDMETINILKSNLAKLSQYEFTYLDDHKNLFQQLNSRSPGLVLNLCDEGFNNDPTKELHVPAFLELMDVPYTGAGPGCLWLCYNKANVRALAASLDVSVPMETYFDPNDQAANLPSYFPALIKPSCGDSSIGITSKSVVHNAEELISYLDYLREILPGVPILIQEYLQGAEYSVSLIGNADKFEVLPILEVDYSELPSDLPPILSYDSKWVPESPYWNRIQYKEAKLDEENYRKLMSFSSRLFERLECQDYARFDYRADSEGNIKLLEVNPNPGWCWDGKLNLMAGFAGMEYWQLLEMILQAAKDRIRGRS